MTVSGSSSVDVVVLVVLIAFLSFMLIKVVWKMLNDLRSECETTVIPGVNFGNGKICV